MNALSQENLGLQSQLGEKLSLIQALEATLTEMDQSEDQSFGKLYDTLEEKTQAITNLDSTCRELMRKGHEMEYEMELLQNTIDDKTREMEELESTCREALRKGQEMEYEVEGLQNTIEEKTQQIADLESTYREAMRKGQEMEYELENLRSNYFRFYSSLHL